MTWTVPRWALACLGFFALATLSGLAEEPRLSLQISKDSSSDKNALKDAKYGMGKTLVEEPSFTAKIRNLGFDPVSGLALKVHILAVSNDWEKSKRDKQFAMVRTFDQKDIQLGLNEERTIELGSAKFESFESTKSSSTQVTLWRGGNRYGGWIAEILWDGKVILFEGSDRTVEKLYEKGEIASRKN